jgi:hypothetical protein
VIRRDGIRDDMLSIFAVPKPFQGHVGVIQRNAIRSWKRLIPQCQIMLFGDEAGSRETAFEFELEFIPDVPRNAFGTPLLNWVFEHAQQRARSELLCYVNSDIMLPADFTHAVRRVVEAHRRFLIVGRTWNVDVSEELDRDVEIDRRSTTDRGPLAMDFFVFRRGTLGRLPPFAVGRPAWDNWMIYRARSRRIPVVDATQSALVVHQSHGYDHVPQGTGDALMPWNGPEGELNAALMRRSRLRIDVYTRKFNLGDATHLLTPARVVTAPRMAGVRGRMRAETHLVFATVPGFLVLKAVHKSHYLASQLGTAVSKHRVLRK